MAPAATGIIVVTLLPIACFVTFVLSSADDKVVKSFHTTGPLNTSYYMTTGPSTINTTDNVTSNHEGQDPKVTGVFQTSGPVNIYLYGGHATYDKSSTPNDKTQSSATCDCPAGPQGPKGETGPQGTRGQQGPMGPQGLPGKTIVQYTNGGQSPFVAFSVVMEERFGPHDVYKVVLFDNVVTNIGSGYKYNNGLFLAPYSGVYQFHVHIHTVNKNRAEVKLRIKEKEQLSIWADGMLDNGSHEMGSSNSLIVHMKKGEMAYCVLPKGQVLAGLRFTSFSGYLLHADELEVDVNQGHGQSIPQVQYASQGQSLQHQIPYATQVQSIPQNVIYAGQGQGQRIPQDVPHLIQGRIQP